MLSNLVERRRCTPASVVYFVCREVLTIDKQTLLVTLTPTKAIVSCRELQKLVMNRLVDRFHNPFTIVKPLLDLAS